MKNLLRISDAAVLAVHALAMLATAEEPLQVSRMAGAINASSAHLGKVLQRLARDRIVSSIRGPKGGFQLVSDPAQLTVLDIFEAVDGTLGGEGCLLGSPECLTPGSCGVRALINEINGDVRERLSGIRLTDVNPTFTYG